MNLYPPSDHESNQGARLSGQSRSTISTRLEQFEKKQNDLWRLTFFLLFVLTCFFVWISWDTIRSLTSHFEALPVGLVILVVLFGAYSWKRTKEMSELRGLVRGIEQRDATPPNDKQLDHLFQIISRSQQGYRDLIDSFDDVLISISLEGEIRAVNRSFADLVGLNFQQIIGRHISEFMEEGNHSGEELVRQAMPRFLERRHWTGVVQVRLKGRNTIHYYDCVAHAMLREEKVHGMTVLARDVTALRRNEARFTELFETLQEGIYIVTPENRILDVNPALVRILGYDSKDELLSKQVTDVFPDEALRNTLREEVERQPVLEGREITLVRKDGNKVVCLNTAAAVRDSSGKIVRYQGAVMDITARREMENRLHKQQELAKRLVDSFPDIIFVVDTQGQYTFVSPRIKDVLGLEPEETMQKGFGGCVHPEDLDILRVLFDEMISGKKSFGSLESRIRHKNGDWRCIRSHFSPLFGVGGEIDGVVVSGRDVTELKRLSEQLIQAEKLAAMGQMLAGVAHELNNPLTAILGVTELARDRENLEDSLKRQLDLTHRQARRAARIVQNLLEFSRPASPQKKPVDLNSIVDRTLQLHEHSLRRNSVEVDFHPNPALPGVIGDANQLIQVFLNLITNAEQAIREVRESGRIQIRLTHSGGRVCATVQDDGVGIAAESLPKIFDPFYTTKRPGGGTGLGLSICLSIVREHSGTIEAEALPAGGSAFTVYLPAIAEKQMPAAKPNLDITPLESVRPVPSAVKGRAILVLDDEESIRDLLAEGLSAHGLEVATAATADEAIAKVSQREYDALLCDLNLKTPTSVESGPDAAKRVLAAAKHHKPAVIFMTGDYVGEGQKNSSDAPYLQKPFRILDVLAALREALMVPVGKS